MLTTVSDDSIEQRTDDITVDITVRDLFEEADPVRLRARSTALYTRDGVLRAQLNATQRSAKVFADDVLVDDRPFIVLTETKIFENDSGVNANMIEIQDDLVWRRPAHARPSRKESVFFEHGVDALGHRSLLIYYHCVINTTWKLELCLQHPFALKMFSKSFLKKIV